MGKKLKVLDLFSGIGMFSYGLHKTGLYETVLFCEWDEPCKKVLRKNFPNTPILGDINFLDGFPLQGKVDVICGGFPCQDLSIANQGGLGLEGSRSGEWKNFRRLIEEIKPRGVIIENVSALLCKGLERILKELDSLGYDAEWHCIPAKDFGAPHERDRLWIIAYCNDLRASGFEPIQCLGGFGQRWESSQENLQQIYNNPFGRSDCWPEPLLRRVDVSRTKWVDRVKQVGNTVYWPIVEFLGYHLHRNITNASL